MCKAYFMLQCYSMETLYVAELSGGARLCAFLCGLGELFMSQRTSSVSMETWDVLFNLFFN